MGQSLDSLASYMEPLAAQLIEQCAAAGIPVAIICTDRTLAEEQADIAKGTSWLSNPEHGKHLPQPPEQKSEAIDICPIAYLRLHNWNPEGSYWNIIGSIGKGLGLEWGGDWTHINGGLGDRSHFQYIWPTSQ